MAESKTSGKSANRTMYDMRELFGGEGEGADPSRWVFVREGERRGMGGNFFDQYTDALEGRRKSPKDNHDTRLYFDTYFEREPRSGEEAEILFFHHFNTTSDFFAHPGNIGKLGLVMRQFLSHYVPENILEDVDPKVSSKLGELEDELMKAAPGGRAAMTDVLRIMYNRSLSLLLRSTEAAGIGADKFGPSGRDLTLIDMPEMLAAKMRMEEIGMARKGKLYCLNEETGEVYERGGWTDTEWAEAKSRIEAECGDNKVAMAARLRNADAFYFPQKVTHSIGSCYNIVRALRQSVFLHCREKSEFSVTQMLARLKEHRVEKDQHDFNDGYGEGYGDRPPLLEAEILEDDEQELDGPHRYEGGEGKVKALPWAGAGGASSKSTEDSGTSKRRKRGEIARDPKKLAARFAKEAGVGAGDLERLEAIFDKNEGFHPKDFLRESGGFVKVAAETGDDVRTWLKNGDRARSQEEAEQLGRRVLGSKAGGGVAILVENEGQTKAVVLRKTGGKIFKKNFTHEEIESGSALKGGKLRLSDGEGVYSFTPIGKIARAAYSDSQEQSRKQPEQGLKRGGIFSFLDRFRHGKQTTK
jgi:hypothetical protein